MSSGHQSVSIPKSTTTNKSNLQDLVWPSAARARRVSTEPLKPERNLQRVVSLIVSLPGRTVNLMFNISCISQRMFGFCKGQNGIKTNSQTTRFNLILSLFFFFCMFSISWTNVGVKTCRVLIRSLWNVFSGSLLVNLSSAHWFTDALKSGNSPCGHGSKWGLSFNINTCNSICSTVAKFATKRGNNVKHANTN